MITNKALAESIRMVDLNTQYYNIKPEIDQAIQNVIDSSAFIKGPDVKLFESELAEYLGQGVSIIGCANGTDALQIALMALGLKPGDEVITTNFSFIATVETIELLKLKPVLVDIDPDTFNIDVTALASALSPKTKAIIPVHLFGQCANMEAICSFAESHQIKIIEDTAQALGAQYSFKDLSKQSAGTIGHIGTTSFFPSKNLGAFGDGGALLTCDQDLANRIREITNHGSNVKYYHERLGVNSRLDTLQAAILRVKLRYLDKYAEARQKAAAFYDKALGNNHRIAIPFRSNDTTHIFHQYTIKLVNINRDHFRSYLKSNGVPSMIYYPVPMHLQKAFSYLGYKQGDFPITEQVCDQVISIPMHTELDEPQLNYITDVINKYSD